MFDAEWRDITHHLGRNILEIAGAIEIPYECERVVQRFSQSARLQDSLA
jgi:hypothetical protein